MAETANDRLYTPDHLWVLPDAAGQAAIGMSDEGQMLLGPVLFADLPEPGDMVQRGQPLAFLETIQEEKELLSPISGTVIAVNPKLDGQPHLINLAPYGEGWLVLLKPSKPAELGGLWSAERYAEWCEALSPL